MYVGRKAKESRPFKKGVDGPERLLPIAGGTFNSASFKFQLSSAYFLCNVIIGLV